MPGVDFPQPIPELVEADTLNSESSSFLPMTIPGGHLRTLRLQQHPESVEESSLREQVKRGATPIISKTRSCNTWSNIKRFGDMASWRLECPLLPSLRHQPVLQTSHTWSWHHCFIEMVAKTGRMLQSPSKIPTAQGHSCHGIHALLSSKSEFLRPPKW